MQMLINDQMRAYAQFLFYMVIIDIFYPIKAILLIETIF